MVPICLNIMGNTYAITESTELAKPTEPAEPAEPVEPAEPADPVEPAEHAELAEPRRTSPLAYVCVKLIVFLHFHRWP